MIFRFCSNVVNIRLLQMESFVARHVLIKLVHAGDGDGDAAIEEAAEADETNRKPGILCFGRRQLWTIGIYIMALIPALIVDDLGREYLVY